MMSTALVVEVSIELRQHWPVVGTFKPTARGDAAVTIHDCNTITARPARRHGTVDNY